MMRKLSFVTAVILGLATFLASASDAQAITPEARSQKIAIMAVGLGAIELPPAWICEIIFAAELAAEALCDPPPCHSANYRSVVKLPKVVGLVHVRKEQLKRLFSGVIDDDTVALYQHALDAQAKVAADELAIAETTARHGVAVARKDERAAALQQQHAQEFVKLAAADKRTVNELWAALLARLDQAKLGDVPLPDSAPGLSRIRDHGFSPATTSRLQQLGMTKGQIEAARAAIAESGPVQMIGTFREVIRAIVHLNENNRDMESCSCHV